MTIIRNGTKALRAIARKLFISNRTIDDISKRSRRRSGVEEKVSDALNCATINLPIVKPTNYSLITV